jgi:hypothetical protein
MTNSITATDIIIFAASAVVGIALQRNAVAQARAQLKKQAARCCDTLQRRKAAYKASHLCNDYKMTGAFSVLPHEVVVKILSHLGTPQEVVKCSYLSHHFQQVTNEEQLWNELAERKYGVRVAEATIHFYEGSWKAMLMDDNERGALPTSKVFKPCMWQYNDDADFQQRHFQREGLFYGCIITALQWDRLYGMLRIYIDVRSEPNLNASDLSFSSMLRPRAPFPWSQLECIPASGVIMQPQRPGHFKGYLEFAQRHFQMDTTYDFCLASHRGNFDSIPILTRSLEETDFDYYTLRHEILSENETREDELARWNKVLPEGFLERRPEWWA